jgi:hypothetical protein
MVTTARHHFFFFRRRCNKKIENKIIFFFRSLCLIIPCKSLNLNYKNVSEILKKKKKRISFRFFFKKKYHTCKIKSGGLVTFTQPCGSIL